MIIGPFDPWRSPFCTCPVKMSLNPYTGCSHGCLYCYATAYIPRFFECRPKSKLKRQIRHDISRLEPATLITLSSSSDPYPPMEKELRLTRGCLEILKLGGMSVQVMTKSNLVSDDADLLGDMKAVVCMTITSLNDSLACILEPGAPRPARRLDAMRRLRDCGVPVSARIDPIIPGINDSQLSEIVSEVCNAGALHITSSTYKAKPDSLKRLSTAFPEEGRALAAMLKTGERIGQDRYLPRETRRRIMLEVEMAATKEGVTFAACREGLSDKSGKSCDGSHLIRSI
jgi:DNA repair photolyase